MDSDGVGACGRLRFFKKDGSEGSFYELAYNQECSIGTDPHATIRLKVVNRSLKPIQCVVKVDCNGKVKLINKETTCPIKMNNKALYDSKYLVPDDTFFVLDKKIRYENDSMTQEEIASLIRKNNAKYSRTVFNRTSLTPSALLKGRDSSTLRPRAIMKRTSSVGRTSFGLSPRMSSFKSLKGSKTPHTKQSLRLDTLRKSIDRRSNQASIMKTPKIKTLNSPLPGPSSIIKTQGGFDVSLATHDSVDLSTPPNHISIIEINSTPFPSSKKRKSRKSMDEDLLPEAKTPKSSFKVRNFSVSSSGKRHSKKALTSLVKSNRKSLQTNIYENISDAEDVQTPSTSERNTRKSGLPLKKSLAMSSLPRANLFSRKSSTKKKSLRHSLVEEVPPNSLGKQKSVKLVTPSSSLEKHRARRKSGSTLVGRNLFLPSSSKKRSLRHSSSSSLDENMAQSAKRRSRASSNFLFMKSSDKKSKRRSTFIFFEENKRGESAKEESLEHSNYSSDENLGSEVKSVRKSSRQPGSAVVEKNSSVLAAKKSLRHSSSSSEENKNPEALEEKSLRHSGKNLFPTSSTEKNSSRYWSSSSLSSSNSLEEILVSEQPLKRKDSLGQTNAALNSSLLEETPVLKASGERKSLRQSAPNSANKMSSKQSRSVLSETITESPINRKCLRRSASSEFLSKRKSKSRLRTPSLDDISSLEATTPSKDLSPIAAVQSGSRRKSLKLTPAGRRSILGTSTATKSRPQTSSMLRTSTARKSGPPLRYTFGLPTSPAGDLSEKSGTKKIPFKQTTFILTEENSFTEPSPKRRLTPSEALPTRKSLRHSSSGSVTQSVEQITFSEVVGNNSFRRSSSTSPEEDPLSITGKSLQEWTPMSYREDQSSEMSPERRSLKHSSSSSSADISLDLKISSNFASEEENSTSRATGSSRRNENSFSESIVKRRSSNSVRNDNSFSKSPADRASNRIRDEKSFSKPPRRSSRSSKGEHSFSKSGANSKLSTQDLNVLSCRKKSGSFRKNEETPVTETSFEEDLAPVFDRFNHENSTLSSGRKSRSFGKSEGDLTGKESRKPFSQSPARQRALRQSTSVLENSGRSSSRRSKTLGKSEEIEESPVQKKTPRKSASKFLEESFNLERSGLSSSRRSKSSGRSEEIEELPAEERSTRKSTSKLFKKSLDRERSRPSSSRRSKSFGKSTEIEYLESPRFSRSSRRSMSLGKSEEIEESPVKEKSPRKSSSKFLEENSNLERSSLSTSRRSKSFGRSEEIEGEPTKKKYQDLNERKAKEKAPRKSAPKFLEESSNLVSRPSSSRKSKSFGRSGEIGESPAKAKSPRTSACKFLEESSNLERSGVLSSRRSKSFGRSVEIEESPAKAKSPRKSASKFLEESSNLERSGVLSSRRSKSFGRSGEIEESPAKAKSPRKSASKFLEESSNLERNSDLSSKRSKSFGRSEEIQESPAKEKSPRKSASKFLEESSILERSGVLSSRRSKSFGRSGEIEESPAKAKSPRKSASKFLEESSNLERSSVLSSKRSKSFGRSEEIQESPAKEKSPRKSASKFLEESSNLERSGVLSSRRSKSFGRSEEIQESPAKEKSPRKSASKFLEESSILERSGILSSRRSKSFGRSEEIEESPADEESARQSRSKLFEKSLDPERNSLSSSRRSKRLGDSEDIEEFPAEEKSARRSRSKLFEKSLDPERSSLSSSRRSKRLGESEEIEESPAKEISPRKSASKLLEESFNLERSPLSSSRGSKSFGIGEEIEEFPAKEKSLRKSASRFLEESLNLERSGVSSSRRPKSFGRSEEIEESPAEKKSARKSTSKLFEKSLDPERSSLSSSRRSKRLGKSEEIEESPAKEKSPRKSASRLLEESFSLERSGLSGSRRSKSFGRSEGIEGEGLNLEISGLSSSGSKGFGEIEESQAKEKTARKSRSKLLEKSLNLDRSSLSGSRRSKSFGKSEDNEEYPAKEKSPRKSVLLQESLNLERSGLSNSRRSRSFEVNEKIKESPAREKSPRKSTSKLWEKSFNLEDSGISSSKKSRSFRENEAKAKSKLLEENLKRSSRKSKQMRENENEESPLDRKSLRESPAKRGSLKQSTFPFSEESVNMDLSSFASGRKSKSLNQSKGHRSVAEDFDVSLKDDFRVPAGETAEEYQGEEEFPESLHILTASPKANIPNVKFATDPRQKQRHSLRRSLPAHRLSDQENVPNSSDSSFYDNTESSVLESTGSSSFYYEKSVSAINAMQQLGDGVRETSSIEGRLKKLQAIPQVKLTTPRGKKREIEASPLTGVKRVRRLIATPKVYSSPRNDLTNVAGVRRLTKTPRDVREPKNAISDITGVRKLMRTPKGHAGSVDDLSDVAGVKRLLRTPRVVKSPNNDLTDIVGVRKLMATPRDVGEESRNDLSDVRGVRRLMRTPKDRAGPVNDLTDVTGLKRLLRTPRHMKSPRNDLTDVVGLRRLMATPRDVAEPKNDLTDVRGVRRLMQTPKGQASPVNDLSDVRGVKLLMRTPRDMKSPRNDLTDVVGLRRLMATPRDVLEPRNDLTDVRGVRSLMQTPKGQVSPVNDLTDVRGVKLLMRTPREMRNDLTDFEGVEELFANSPDGEDLRDVAGTKVAISSTDDLTDFGRPLGALGEPEKNDVGEAVVGPSNDFSAVSGVNRLRKTPKIVKTAVNDSAKIESVKQMSTAPCEIKEQQDDHNDVRGLLTSSPDLMATSQEEGNDSVIFVESAAESSFDALLNKKPLRTYRGKSATPLKPADKIGSPEGAYEDTSSNAVKEIVEKWVEEHSKFDQDTPDVGEAVPSEVVRKSARTRAVKAKALFKVSNLTKSENKIRSSSTERQTKMDQMSTLEGKTRSKRGRKVKEPPKGSEAYLGNERKREAEITNREGEDKKDQRNLENKNKANTKSVRGKKIKEKIGEQIGDKEEQERSKENETVTENVKKTSESKTRAPRGKRVKEAPKEDDGEQIKEHIKPSKENEASTQAIEGNARSMRAGKTKQTAEEETVVSDLQEQRGKATRNTRKTKTAATEDKQKDFDIEENKTVTENVKEKSESKTRAPRAKRVKEAPKEDAGEQIKEHIKPSKDYEEGAQASEGNARSTRAGKTKQTPEEETVVKGTRGKRQRKNEQAEEVKVETEIEEEKEKPVGKSRRKNIHTKEATVETNLEDAKGKSEAGVKDEVEKKGRNTRARRRSKSVPITVSSKQEEISNETRGQAKTKNHDGKETAKSTRGRNKKQVKTETIETLGDVAGKKKKGVTFQVDSPALRKSTRSPQKPRRRSDENYEFEVDSIFRAKAKRPLKQRAILADSNVKDNAEDAPESPRRITRKRKEVNREETEVASPNIRKSKRVKK